MTSTKIPLLYLSQHLVHTKQWLCWYRVWDSNGLLFLILSLTRLNSILPACSSFFRNCVLTHVISLPCFSTETKENVFMIIELNSQRICWVHQHCRRDVKWKHSIDQRVQTNCESINYWLQLTEKSRELIAPFLRAWPKGKCLAFKQHQTLFGDQPFYRLATLFGRVW